MGQPLLGALAQVPVALPLAVAFSGGADSTALLLNCVQKWPGQVGAIHVNHGLQAAAHDFERHCQTVCERLKVPLVVRRVQAGHAPGQSPEEAARNARYTALDESALDEWPDLTPEKSRDPSNETIQGAKIKSVLLAQHADDQAETLILALSRGAGLAGLAAMPRHWLRQGVHFHRPFLGVAAADIRAWLAAEGQGFIDDLSNTDQRFTRNRIRALILPALQQTFPHFRSTFARSARHAAQAVEILAEVAAQDLALVARQGDLAPVISSLQSLSRARQANVLRHWLKTAANTVPSAAQLDELTQQIAACTTRGHHIQIKVGHGFVIREAQVLAWYNPRFF